MTVGFPRHYTVDPMFLPSEKPFKCHEEVLFFFKQELELVTSINSIRSTGIIVQQQSYLYS